MAERSLMDVLLGRAAKSKDINLPLSGSPNPEHRAMARRQAAEAKRKAAEPTPTVMQSVKEIKRKVNPFDRIADVLDKAGKRQ